MASPRHDIIAGQLTQKPLDSKKAIYALVASGCVLLIFAVSSFLISSKTEASHDIVQLASLAVMFFVAVTTTLITGQAAFDWKAMSTLGNLNVSETQDQHIESNQALPE
jgi:peptidoglycan/LPS O-acetylase OafA/YrhL